MDGPLIPPKPLSGDDVAEYLLRIHAAFEDCRSTVEEVRKWAEEATK